MSKTNQAFFSTWIKSCISMNRVMSNWFKKKISSRKMTWVKHSFELSQEFNFANPISNIEMWLDSMVLMNRFIHADFKFILSSGNVTWFM